MGFLKKMFGEKEAEAEETTGKINANAPLHQNTLICNACGKEIEGRPKFFNLNGRHMIFHKGCFKKLRNGNLTL